MNVLSTRVLYGSVVKPLGAQNECRKVGRVRVAGGCKGGIGRSKASRAGERAGHWAIKWKASSGARLHRLQMAEGGEGEGEEGRKRQMSDSSPPQLNRTLILEMFFLEMLGKPRITSQ